MHPPAYLVCDQATCELGPFDPDKPHDRRRAAEAFDLLRADHPDVATAHVTQHGTAVLTIRLTTTTPKDPMTHTYAPTGRQQISPLPFNDLERAAKALAAHHGAQHTIAVALTHLQAVELGDLQHLIDDRDIRGLRRRLRVIASGSLRAAVRADHNDTLLAKALAAKTLELAGAAALKLPLADVLEHAPWMTGKPAEPIGHEDLDACQRLRDAVDHAHQQTAGHDDSAQALAA